MRCYQMASVGDGTRELKWELVNAVRSNEVDLVKTFLDDGGDPNTTCDEPFTGSSLLSIACDLGYIDLVKLLVSRGANVEHRDAIVKYTPFLKASKHGHVPVLQFLLDQGCNKNARTVYNNGALLIACFYGHKDTVQFLVDVGQFEVNEKQQFGMTGLHWAALKGHTDLCAFLLERDGNVNSQDQRLQTALHLACRLRQASCAEFLISKGADTNIKDKSDKMPHEYATGYLWNIVRFANLYAGGTVCLECLKICLMGDILAGKTTLAKAMKRTWLWSLFSSDENARDTMDINERTAGMTVYKETISSIGHTMLCDFSGQEQFHHTHNIFFDESNSLSVLVVSGLLSRAKMFDQCRHWAAFLTAASRPGAVPVIVVVVSRRDLCPDPVQVKETAQGIVMELRGMFKSALDIQERFFFLDCRKSQSTEMISFRTFLAELKKKKLEAVRKYPKLVEPVIKKLLPRLRKEPSTKLIEKSSLTSLITTELTVPQIVDYTIPETVNFLHASGEAFLMKDLALLDIPWMSHSLIGPVMAPRHFPEHLEAAESRRKQGTATKQEICTVIQNFNRRHGKQSGDINIDYATKALEALEVIFELEGQPGVYCIPAHLPYKDRMEVWKKSDDPQVCYVGRRVECIRDIDIFTLAVFVFFQTRMAVAINRKAVLYRGGIKVARVVGSDSIVECLVELTKYDRAVDMIARANNNGRCHALKLLQEVYDILVQVLEEKSPGLLTRGFLLHVPFLIECQPGPFGFPEEEIGTAIVEDLMAVDLLCPRSVSTPQTVTSARPTCGCLIGLYQQAFHVGGPQMKAPVSRECSAYGEREAEPHRPSDPYSDLKYVQRAVLKSASQEWYSIGRQLGFSRAKIITMTHKIDSSAGKLQLVIDTKAEEVGQQVTAGLVLDACERLPNPIIIKEVRKCTKEISDH